MMNAPQSVFGFFSAHSFTQFLAKARSHSARQTTTASLGTGVCRIAAGLALALGLFLAAPLYAPSAFAQNPAPSANETVEHSPWQTNFDEQVASILKQEPPRRASSLRVVIEVATSSKDVNLTRTVGSLLDIIERDSNREHRMMAVQALSHIGTEHVAENYYRQAMGQLYALMQSEPSAQVRAAALGTFTQFRNSG